MEKKLQELATAEDVTKTNDKKTADEQFPTLDVASSKLSTNAKPHSRSRLPRRAKSQVSYNSVPSIKRGKKKTASNEEDDEEDLIEFMSWGKEIF